MRITVPLGSLLMAGCAAPSVELSPASGSMAGYFEVRADLRRVAFEADEVQGGTLGGVPIYDVVADGDGFRFQVQGAPTPGPADLELFVGGDSHRFDDVFTYEPAVDPLFDRFWAIGASLTQGVQGGVPTRWAQLHSPGRVVAAQAGAHYALPLLNEDVFPTIDAEDIGPPPACEVPNVVSFVASAAVDVLAKINDVEADRLDFSLARATPDLAPRDVAVGGSNLTTLVDGPGEDFATGFLAKLVYAVDLEIADPVDISQLDLVEAGEPTLIVCTDCYGNDLITAIVEGATIDPSRVTPDEVFRPKLEELVARTAGTGAEVFLANMPRPTTLPATDEKIRAAVHAAEELATLNGEDPVAAGAAELADQEERASRVDEAGARFNAMLEEVAADYPNVHVVDFAGEVERIQAEGLMVDGATLSVRKLDGLLSTDGVHFSDTGYAMLANLFLDAIEADLGVVVPRADLGLALATDPYAPDALLGQGLDVTACDPR